MKKVTCKYDVFCDRQCQVLKFLEKHKMIEVVDFINIADPVSDSIFCCKRLFIKTNAWFDGILCWIINKSIDQDGHERIDRLMRRGLVDYGPDNGSVS